MMRQRITRAIKSEQGMSILFALFAFIVAAMVSTVIITAAATVVKQNKDQQNEQQGLIALQDAGQLISDGMSGTTVTKTTVAVGDGNPTVTYDAGSTAFSSLATDLIKNSSTSGSFNINATVKSSGDMNVSVEYEVIDNAVVFTLTYTNPNDSSRTQNLYVSCMLNTVTYEPVTETTAEGKKQTTTVVKYTWNPGVFGTSKASVSNAS